MSGMRLLAAGPFLLSAALALALFKFSIDQWSFIVAALTGFFLSWQWRMPGFLVSLCVLCCLSIGQPLWQMGWALAVSSAWLVTLLSLQETALNLNSREKKDQEQISRLTAALQEAERLAAQEKKEGERAIAAVERHAQKMMQEKLVDEKLFEGLRANYLKAVHANMELKEDHAKALSALQSELEASKASWAAYLKQLNSVRVENYQLALLREIPVSQKDRELEQSYQQLRKQFEEKSKVLRQTRKELFHVENQLLALQKQTADQALDLNSSEAALIANLSELEAESEELQTQVDALEEIISELIPKKKMSKASVSKKEPLQSCLRF